MLVGDYYCRGSASVLLHHLYSPSVVFLLVASANANVVRIHLFCYPSIRFPLFLALDDNTWHLDVLQMMLPLNFKGDVHVR